MLSDTLNDEALLNVIMCIKNSVQFSNTVTSNLAYKHEGTKYLSNKILKISRSDKINSSEVEPIIFCI